MSIVVDICHPQGLSVLIPVLGIYSPVREVLITDTDKRLIEKNGFVVTPSNPVLEGVLTKNNEILIPEKIEDIYENLKDEVDQALPPVKELTDEEVIFKTRIDNSGTLDDLTLVLKEYGVEDVLLEISPEESLKNKKKIILESVLQS